MMLPKQVPFHVEVAFILALSVVHLLLLSMQLYIINSTIIENQLETHRVLRKMVTDHEQVRNMIEQIHVFSNKHEVELTFEQLRRASPQKQTP